MSSSGDRLRTAVGFGGDGVDHRRAAVAGLVAVLAAIALLGTAFPDTVLGAWLDFLIVLAGIVAAEGTLSSALRLSVPIALAALGGIFAEKSGVINIGLEGLLIISAFASVLAADVAAGGGTVTQVHLWLGFGTGVAVSVGLAGLFGIACIRYEADQIIAGLAVWLIALGLAPFGARVVYGSPNTDNLGTTLPAIPIPVLSELPYLGALFSADPTVYLLFVAVPASWYLLNRTAFGMHLRAAGENPQALDTVGVDVSRVRYAGVLLSGLLSGVGGAALSLTLGGFVGNGQTMVNGKGFIAIVAYLFGNYNPVGALGASLLFAGLEAIQIRLQFVEGYAFPDALVRTIPFVTVIVVLTLVGRTRLPAAAGEHFESGDD